MSKKAKHVPNAWDDEDWEVLADRAEEEAAKEAAQEPPVRLSKSERLALHHESNRKLWESAESPEPFHFLEATSNVPLATAYKTQVKVLSRKPIIAKRDPAGANANGPLDDNGDQEDKEAEEKEDRMTAEERMALGKSVLEEKQRAYDEARRRIFGEEAVSEEQKQGAAAVRTDGNNGSPRGLSRGRGRGRGGRGRGFSGAATGSGRNSGDSRGGSPARPAQSGNRELYDPGYTPKLGGALLQRPDRGPQVNQGGAREYNQIAAVREPRGPDGSGRGGFGFARRGARGS